MDIYEGLGAGDVQALKSFIDESEFLTEELVAASITEELQGMLREQAAFYVAYDLEKNCLGKKFNVPEELLDRVVVSPNYMATDYDFKDFEIEDILEDKYPEFLSHLGK